MSSLTLPTQPVSVVVELPTDMSVEFTDRGDVAVSEDGKTQDAMTEDLEKEDADPVTPPGLLHQIQALQIYSSISICSLSSSPDLSQHQYRDILPIIDVDAEDVFEADADTDLRPDDSDLTMVDPDMFDDLSACFSRLTIDTNVPTADLVSLATAPSDILMFSLATAHSDVSMLSLATATSDISMLTSESLPTLVSVEMLTELEGELQLDQELNLLLGLDQEEVVVREVNQQFNTTLLDDIYPTAPTGKTMATQRGASRRAQSNEDASTSTFRSARTRRQPYVRPVTRSHQRLSEDKPRVTAPMTIKEILEAVDTLVKEEKAKETPTLSVDDDFQQFLDTLTGDSHFVDDNSYPDVDSGLHSLGLFSLPSVSPSLQDLLGSVSSWW